MSLTEHGNLAVLGAIVVSSGLFGETGARARRDPGREITAIAGLLLYLCVAEPAVPQMAAFRSWTPTCPPTA